VHIIFLHQTGSNNPLGINRDSDRVPFHKYYSIKDTLGYTIVITIFLSMLMFSPNIFTDPENYLIANPLTTPIHIQPEWYFLWVYAILRSIPNKLGGVVALALSLLILFTLPFTKAGNKLRIRFYPIRQLIFWTLVRTWLVLTWIGGRPVEEPYIVIGQVATTLYFLFFLINPITTKLWDKLLK
jgi:ubiquinol-cytochrome c reductase cytochrome b subunit